MPKKPRRRPRAKPARGRPSQSTQHPLRAASRQGRARKVVLGPRIGGPAEGWLAGRRTDGSFEAAGLLRHADWAVLEPLVERLGRDPADVLPRLAAYLARVLTWNRTVSNLVSHADESRLVSRHLRESLEPAAWIMESNGRKCLDFGSGAGFPALPLAIAGVGTEWSLVESRRPKVLFLRSVIQELGLKAVRPIHARLEDLIHGVDGLEEVVNELHGRNIDVFTSRATLTMEPTLELAASVVRVGGSAFLWKGSRRNAEMASGSAAEHGWALDREMGIEGAEVAVLKFNLTR